MSASYPSATKSFTTKSDGSTVQAAHVNDLQDEVVAVENGLRTGVAHDLIPDTDDTRDLGSASKQWQDVFVSGTMKIDGTTFASTSALTSYTPTLTGSTTNPSLGNGTLSGRYLQIGKVVFLDIYFVFGSTSTAGSGNWTFALPVTASDTNGQVMSAVILDSGTRFYSVAATLSSTTKVGMSQTDASGAAVTHSSPITWATGDTVRITGFYVAA